MNREEKAAVVEEIAAQLGDAGAIFAVDYRGIGVPEAAELRARLAESDATLRIVKNRLAKRAAESAGTAELDELFEGPTALTLVKGDPLGAAKAIADFAREHDVPTYKGGIMDGAPLDPEQFMRIARLPGLEVLQGQLLGAVASPITGVARGLNGMLAGLASQLGQIQDQGLVEGEAEEPKAEAPKAEEPEAEEPGPEAEAGSEEGSEEDQEADADEAGEPEAEEADGD
ncbi:MAG: 50S ribosomal protein L10 [Solirubrobacterales bacterium]